MTAPLAITTAPPPFTVVPLATPPDATASAPPPSTTKPETVAPDCTARPTAAPLRMVTPSMT